MAPKTKLNLKDRCENGELDLSMSDLQEVPVREIATVKKVTSLDLSNNRLVTLGKTFTTLLHITKLDLSKNLLRELPEDFGEMKQLRHLDLYSNQISHLPLSFCELKGLRWLDLKNNPLVPAVAKIVGPCLDAQQCQQSARAAVAFLSEMRARVEEERERLRLAESARLELQQDKERQQRKRNERKKVARAKKKESGARREPQEEAERRPSADASEPSESRRQEARPAVRAGGCRRSARLLVWSVSVLLALAAAPLLLAEQTRRELAERWLPEGARPWARWYGLLAPGLDAAWWDVWNRTAAVCRTLSDRVLVMTDRLAKLLS